MILLEQKLVHDSSATNSSWLPISFRVNPKSFEWPTNPRAIRTTPCLFELLFSHFPLAHTVPAALASSMLLITAATFGAFPLAPLFAWSILSPGYPHAFSFTFFISQLTKSSVIALYIEQHPPQPLHSIAPLPCPVFFHSTHYYLTYL